MRIKITLILCWSLILFSCNNKKDATKETVSTTEINYDSLNTVNSMNLVIKQNAIPFWQDSIAYSYIYQKELEGKIIPLKGNIIDIIKRGDKYILSIDGSGKASAVAFILLDSVQLIRITSEIKRRHTKGLFIIDVNKVIPITEDVETAHGYYSGDPADENSYNQVETEIQHELTKQIQIKGSLIDYYIYKRQQ